MRPLNYLPVGGSPLGHYAVAQKSGVIVATIGAGGVNYLASARWAPTSTNALCAILRIRVGISIHGAVTTAVEMALQATILRGFSTDFTTASTAASLVQANTNKMRSTGMGPSLMGANGPRICTTTIMSGQVATADANPFAMETLPLLVATNSVGTAVALPAGSGSPMVDLYKWEDLGEHPPLLAVNEGIGITLVNTGPADGTFQFYWKVKWAEVGFY